MEESEGAFGKRRRNLMIVGIITIILFVAKPDLSEVTLFGITFSFIGKEWSIWLGLTLWFVYSVIRVRSYYLSHIQIRYLQSRRCFYYYNELHNEWHRMVQEDYDALIASLTEDERTLIEIHVGRLSKPTVHLKRDVEEGKIPGDIELIYNLQFDAHDDKDTQNEHYIREVKMELTPAMENQVKKQKRKFRKYDDWWEYAFIALFASVVLALYIIHWVMFFIR